MRILRACQTDAKLLTALFIAVLYIKYLQYTMSTQGNITYDVTVLHLCDEVWSAYTGESTDSRLQLRSIQCIDLTVADACACSSTHCVTQ
jgi:hypothetical protein